MIWLVVLLYYLQVQILKYTKRLHSIQLSTLLFHKDSLFNWSATSLAVQICIAKNSFSCAYAAADYLLHKWTRVEEQKKRVKLRIESFMLLYSYWPQCCICCESATDITRLLRHLLRRGILIHSCVSGCWTMPYLSNNKKKNLTMTSRNPKITWLARSICSITHKHKVWWNSRTEPSSCWSLMSVARWRLYTAIAMAPFHLM